MKSSNYKVKRDEIYVGKLIKVNSGTFKIDNSPYNIMFNNLPDKEKESIMKCYGHLYTHSPSIHFDGESSYYRTILFVVDENKLANDLLFDSPSYPIMNISKNEECLKSSFVIEKCFNFGEILKYYNYSNILQFEDIENIKNMFFKDGDYLLDNCEMFGRLETDANETGIECVDSHGRHRTFNETINQHLDFLKYQMIKKGTFDETELPKYVVLFDDCYFIAFWLSGRYSLIPNNGIEENTKVLKLH